MKTLYEDKLLTLTESGFLFRCYYFPFGRKRVTLETIKTIEVLPPGLRNGSWRLWGSGDFRTWFPLDLKRPKRNRIFLMSLKSQSCRIGFTVENFERFLQILQELRLLTADKA